MPVLYGGVVTTSQLLQQKSLAANQDEIEDGGGINWNVKPYGLVQTVLGQIL